MMPASPPNSASATRSSPSRYALDEVRPSAAAISLFRPKKMRLDRRRARTSFSAVLRMLLVSNTRTFLYRPTQSRTSSMIASLRSRPFRTVLESVTFCARFDFGMVGGERVAGGSASLCPKRGASFVPQKGSILCSFVWVGSAATCRDVPAASAVGQPHGLLHL
eukprot:scaffold1612_cov137-Isochrysis_galbana.AAC.3